MLEFSWETPPFPQPYLQAFIQSALGYSYLDAKVLLFDLKQSFDLKTVNLFPMAVVRLSSRRSIEYHVVPEQHIIRIFIYTFPGSPY